MLHTSISLKKKEKRMKYRSGQMLMPFYLNVNHTFIHDTHMTLFYRNLLYYMDLIKTLTNSFWSI